MAERDVNPLRFPTGTEFLAVEALDFARELIREESAALELVASRLGDSFLNSIQKIWAMTEKGVGRLAITGTGKSADVGYKMVGTLNSTGTRSYFLDAVRAVHGDLGMVHPQDLALVLSHSGESEEILRLLGPLRQECAGIIGLTGNRQSTLAKRADVTIAYGPLEEVCPLGLAPSASSTAMIAVGDAMAFCLSQARSFSPEEFARFHPAGSLGKKLMSVESVMRHGQELRISPDWQTVREVFSCVGQQGRRTGAVMLTADSGILSGLFTDSDLARLIEKRMDEALDRPIAEVMTRKPLTVTLGSKLEQALDLMRTRKLSEVPVVDGGQRPAGLLDITDLIGFAPGLSQGARVA
ncbi:MAG: KpsF/GutQ family sugar-phosphate isomerase [Gemmataceae bacterium]|nr:KpsF/GutQ family sugar-phosphate isomerase [Gemmataceae bacterium]